MPSNEVSNETLGREMDQFLDDFPTVKREQAVALLEHAKHILVAGAGSPG